ncbi:hypothetical protein HDU84_006983 [Entophlyctis sp. JEL0112]|nr:hypothetical protein HDU84_006983 [Entophlyctis sp. JEL0112]
MSTVTVNTTNTAGWAAVSFGATSMASTTGYGYVGWADATSKAQISARMFTGAHAMPTYVSTVESLSNALAVQNSVLAFSFDIPSTPFTGVTSINCIYATSATAPTDINTASSNFAIHLYKGTFVLNLAPAAAAAAGANVATTVTTQRTMATTSTSSGTVKGTTATSGTVGKTTTTKTTSTAKTTVTSLASASKCMVVPTVTMGVQGGGATVASKCLAQTQIGTTSVIRQTGAAVSTTKTSVNVLQNAASPERRATFMHLILFVTVAAAMGL